MGKASRRKRAHPGVRAPYRAPIPFVPRPYAGLAGEVELVAMREFVPCGTLTARTDAAHGAREFDFATLLPDGVAAMVRPDGRILVGAQTRFHSGDLSHDQAAGLLAAIQAADAGRTGVVEVDVRDPAPRLQDVLAPDWRPHLDVAEDFGFWFDPHQEVTEQMARALVRNREDVVPTAEVPGVRGMYWCRMSRTFVRYVQQADEDRTFAALARLQVAGRARLGEGSRFAGAFRACGLAIPVFELAAGQSAEDAAADAVRFARDLDGALAVADALSQEERRARDGLVSRQVTVR